MQNAGVPNAGHPLIYLYFIHYMFHTFIPLNERISIRVVRHVSRAASGISATGFFITFLAQSLRQCRNKEFPLITLVLIVHMNNDSITDRVTESTPGYYPEQPN